MSLSSNPTPLKLTYFSDGKGRNELVRLIFAVGETSYEDNLIGVTEYTKMRDTNELPYGQLPVLTITALSGDAHIYGQSCAIARYAARISGLYPKDEIEMLRTDGVVDSWRDTLDLFYETVFSRQIIGGRLMMTPQPPSARVGKLASFFSHELTEQFSRYERMLSKTGQVCSDKSIPFPSWADLAVFDLVKTMESVLTDKQFCQLMNEKIALSSLVEKIGSLETIKSHLEKYPYRNMSHFFKPVSPLKRLSEIVMFPMVHFCLAIYTRFQAMIARRTEKIE